MICYVCDHQIDIPLSLKEVIACPNCKRNIITDGIDNSEHETLRNAHACQVQTILELQNDRKTDNEFIDKLQKDIINLTEKNVKLERDLLIRDNFPESYYLDNYNFPEFSYQEDPDGEKTIKILKDDIFDLFRQMTTKDKVINDLEREIIDKDRTIDLLRQEFQYD